MPDETDNNIQDVLISDDAIVCRGESELYEVTLYSGTSDPGSVIVYDGLSTADYQRFKASALQKETKQYIFNPPLKMQLGIYLDITVTSGSCFVRFKALRE